MPKVQIHLYATLRAYAGGARCVEVDIRPGQTVEEVLGGLGVPAAQMQILFVDGRAAVLSQHLQGGERVGVFPAIGGG